ncbi:ATP-dependent nuclease subunit B [Streptococcus fryi]
MKLLYTEMDQDLTAFLAEQAKAFSNKQKRVFYLAPNSLSFEKERKVLEFLPRKASFEITITRFAQMARYFILKENESSKPIDEKALSMVFYQVLSKIADGELQRYGKLKEDAAFIKQLVSLYQELKKSQMTITDLEGVEEKKKADLVQLFAGVEVFLRDNNMALQSPLARFSAAISSGHLDDQLSDVVVIVDGFTRFSAEEEEVICLLNQRCHELVIGTYASQKAYKATYRQGNVYEASVDFLRYMAETFQTKPEFVSSTVAPTAFSVISNRVEDSYGFHQELKDVELSESPVIVWEVSTQKAELEAVARDIRAKLFEGYRYKDILVLLGDVDAYRLQMSHLFKRYDIPYYLGKAESMAHHPLVHFVESLERLKRYRFRAEDLINLLKTGLYGSLSMDEIDNFEQYVRFADLKGWSRFEKAFTHNKDNRFDLEQLNHLRLRIMEPLISFLKPNTSRSISQLLTKWANFLEQVELTDRLAELVNKDSALQLEQHDEVWRTFTQILETINTVFQSEKLTVSAFLSLLTTGLQGADYRVVPATVDVVTVKSYDLIEPHTTKIVYAIGLTQGNFPKQTKQLSLITDEERLKTNESLSKRRLDIPSQDNQKKHHFVLMSLLNAASDQLILSSPRRYQEGEEGSSSYLQLLVKLGLPTEEKGSRGTAVDDLGSYYGLLSRLIDFYQSDLTLGDFSKEEQTFWSVAIRTLKKRLAKEGLSLPEVTDDLSLGPVSQEAILVRYPKDQLFQLSTSALTEFYNNEYGFFLRYVLGLQEDISIHPDARSYGNFLHRVFELVLSNPSAQDFDAKLQQAIETTKQEPDYNAVYNYDEQSQYTQRILEDIAHATSLILRDNSVIDIVAEEAVFGGDNQNIIDLTNGYQLSIRGKIDRLDRLKDLASYGVVDYKSSDRSFNLGEFYNKISPQLMTYITALTKDQSLQAHSIFGAMYLHMQEPHIHLAKTKSTDEVLAQAHNDLRYKGLFLDSQTNRLNQHYASQKSQFTAEEFEVMIAYTFKLYQEAAEKILSGHFSINPYTKDGQSVLGRQFKAITGFEANRHMSYARLLTDFPRKDNKEVILQTMRGELDK